MRTVREIMQSEGLLRPIHKVPVAITTHGAPFTEVPGVFALEQGGTPLPNVSVGSRYTVLQNEELATMADEVALKLSLTADPIVLSWAGATRLSVRLPVHGFSVGLTGQDETQAQIGIDNRHGDGGVGVCLYLYRLVCKNGMKRMIRAVTRVIAHTLSVQARVELALEHAAAGMLTVRGEGDRARFLANRALTQDEVRTFFLTVHERVYGPLPTEEGRKRQNAIERVAAWVRNMEDPRQTIDGIQGTAWAVLQSVVQWADHEAPSRDRAASADHGALADLKAVADQVLAEVVA